MTRIWFCRTCGYEVSSRGRCHLCKRRLSESPLAELAPGDEDDEVGYRVEDLDDAQRVALIVGLIEANVAHRFEDDELVIDAGDEERTDDLVERVRSDLDDDFDGIDDGDLGEEDGDNGAAGGSAAPPGAATATAADPAVAEGVDTLARAARRLAEDPTDMQADSDVAEMSAVVFIADTYGDADDDTWAAVGRVTRRLLGALGAEDALEDEIRLQAGILARLLAPLVGVDPTAADAGVTGPGPVAGARGGPVVIGADVDSWGTQTAAPATAGDDVEEPLGAGARPATDDPDAAGSEADPSGTGDEPAGDDAATGDDAGTARGEAVYELPEWLPEQRAELSVHLDASGIPHAWEGDELVVAVAHEVAVEALFDRVEGIDTDEDDSRYQALEALFAATDRLAADPASRSKGAEVVRAVVAAEGPTPVGFDDAQWWSIRKRARILADSIEHTANVEVVRTEAGALRDLLRSVV